MTPLVTLLVAAGPADAAYRIGIGEQSPEMFSTPACGTSGATGSATAALA